MDLGFLIQEAKATTEVIQPGLVKPQLVVVERALLSTPLNLEPLVDLVAEVADLVAVFLLEVPERQDKGMQEAATVLQALMALAAAEVLELLVATLQIQAQEVLEGQV